MVIHYNSLDDLRQKYAGSFFAVLPTGLREKKTLLAAVAGALAFPGYFGGNFDALRDCLRSMDMMDKQDVLLVHRDIPGLGKEELGVYLEILRDAEDFWLDGDGGHVFTAAFPEGYGSGF